MIKSGTPITLASSSVSFQSLQDVAVDSDTDFDDDGITALSESFFKAEIVGTITGGDTTESSKPSFSGTSSKSESLSSSPKKEK